MLRALLDEALSCVTCWGQPHCHSSLHHLASQDMLSVTQLPSIPWRRQRAAFSCSLLLAIPAEGCQAPAMQSAPGTHTPTAALIIPDTHPTGLVFKVELGSHNWSNRIVVHELLPCLTPKLHKGCMLYPVFICSLSHKTTDTTTETHLSKTQILLLLLFMRIQEKSLVLLSAFMTICTLHCGIHSCWAFPTTA